MKCNLIVLKEVTLTFFLVALSSSSFAELNKGIEKDFWGELYKEGGTTFYCNKAFTKKTALISESHIYSGSWVRDHLQCGTNRQCRKNNLDYQKIMSDLHNIVPADAYFAFKRENTIFGELDDSAPFIAGKIRKRDHIIEPPDEIKGDIARTILYMHQQYNLPLVMNFSLLELWRQDDPPSKSEIERNIKIAAIQGNKNPFISNTALTNIVKR